MSCPDRDTLLRLTLGDASENDAGRLRLHVAGCPRCSSELLELSSLLESARGGPQVPERDDAFVAAVMGRVATEASSPGRALRPKRWPWLAAAAMLALTAGAGVFLRARRADDAEFVARGAPISREALLFAEVVVVRGSEAGTVEGVVLKPDDRLGVRYSNLTASPAYLMAFGQDSEGTVHWLFPAWVDESQDPESVPVPAHASLQLADELVALDRPAAGAIRWLTLLTERPVSVRQIEARIGSAKPGRPLAESLGVTFAREVVSIMEHER